jgi:hypothetical protein
MLSWHKHHTRVVPGFQPCNTWRTSAIASSTWMYFLASAVTSRTKLLKLTLSPRITLQNRRVSISHSCRMPSARDVVSISFQFLHVTTGFDGNQGDQARVGEPRALTRLPCSTFMRLRHPAMYTGRPASISNQNHAYSRQIKIHLLAVTGKQVNT